MKAKKKQAVEVSVNGGNLCLFINGNGAVVVDGNIELTAKDLDGAASASVLSVMAKKAWDKVPENTRGEGWEVTHDGEGGASFGCQDISAADIAIVHKISLKQRGK